MTDGPQQKSIKSAEEVTAEYSRLLRESVARNPFKPIASRAPEPEGFKPQPVLNTLANPPRQNKEELERVIADMAPPPLKEGELAVPDSCVSVFGDPAPQDDVVNDLAIKFCQQIRGDCWGDLDLDEVRSGLFAAYHRGQQSAQDIRNAALEESACEAECGFLDSTAATGIRGLKSVQPKAEEEHDKKYKALMEFYDNHVGTPCEQIRHACEVEALQSQVNKLREGLHTILCNTEDGAISHKDYAHLAKDISDCARAYLADTAPMEGK